MTQYKRLEKGSNGTLWALLADGTYQEARFCFNYFSLKYIHPIISLYFLDR